MSQAAPVAAERPTVYVADGKQIPEFTVQAVILGFVLSILFNAANAYLGLKIGLTVSASIPSAIISMGVLRMILPKLLKRDATILENMIVHSVASNGEALAAAVIFTVPALLFMPGGSISNGKVFLLGATGGILGMLMMIPLRYSLVVTEHKTLPFPEGTACAEVLIAGDKGGASAAPVFMGILTGGLFKFVMSGLNLFRDIAMWTFPELHQAGFGYEISPLLAGVGYLVGLRIVSMMLAGGLLGYFVLIPLIHYLGGHNIVYPGTMPIDTMVTAQLRSTYVRYIGAGGVVFGGLISLIKSLPEIFASIGQNLALLKRSRAARRGGPVAQADREQGAIVFGGALLGFLVGSFAYDAHWRIGPEEWSSAAQLAAGISAHIVLGGGLGAALGAVAFYFAAQGAVRFGGGARTEHDLPLVMVGGGIVAMFLVLWLVPAFGLSFIEAALVVLFCFFFVAVASRMVGLIGSTNQPVSGMTITALLSLTLLFVLLGHDKSTVQTAAIMGGAVVCIAISLSSDLSQDMKTALLVGATPWKVQLTHIMGTLVSAVRSGFILLLLYWVYGLGAPTIQHPHPLEAPQAQLMASLVQGATGGNLPWTLLLTGMGIGLVCELSGISALAFSIGLYLPITNWPMMMAGGLIAWYVKKKRGGEHAENDPGSLFASGLIAGDALMGIGLALIVVLGATVAPGLAEKMTLRDPASGSDIFEKALSTLAYVPICWLLYRYAMSKKKHA